MKHFCYCVDEAGGSSLNCCYKCAKTTVLTACRKDVQFVPMKKSVQNALINVMAVMEPYVQIATQNISVVVAKKCTVQIVTMEGSLMLNVANVAGKTTAPIAGT